MLILKFICLLVGVWFTYINLALVHSKNDIPALNVFLASLGIVGFIFLQFFL